MKIISDVIEIGSINRPQTPNSCKYITVHDTANKSRGADAAAHAKYIKRISDLTSWHYTVDDKVIYQHLPDNEKSYHTSSATANESSIAIELCVNTDGDFERTKANAAWLIQMLISKYGIPAKNILAHRDWTGKEYPASLRGKDWDLFLQMCASAKEPEKHTISIDELRSMGYTSITL